MRAVFILQFLLCAVIVFHAENRVGIETGIIVLSLLFQDTRVCGGSGQAGVNTVDTGEIGPSRALNRLRRGRKNKIKALNRIRLGRKNKKKAKKQNEGKKKQIGGKKKQNKRKKKERKVQRKKPKKGIKKRTNKRKSKTNVNRKQNKKKSKKKQKKDNKSFQGKQIKKVLTGDNCNWMDFGTARSRGANCEDGTKMVIKNK